MNSGWSLIFGLVIATNTAFGFEFRRAAETVEEVGTVVVCILEGPRGQYAFRPPFNWDATYDEQSKTVTLAPKKDPKSWITVRLASSTNSPSAGVKAYVQSAFPRVEFGEQFAMHTASSEAEVADFTDASSGPIPLKRRVALVRSPSGTFELMLSSRADDFKAGEQSFGQLLGSFEFRQPSGKAAAQ